jgi:integrase
MSLSGVRGVYEVEKGSGVWWIRWADHVGVIHREKIGPKPLAIAAYQKRKTQVREDRLFPTMIQNRITFDEILEDFKAAKQNHWSGMTGKNMPGRFEKWFSGYRVAGITAQMITVRLNTLAKENNLTPASINRNRSVLSAIFNWAVRNGKLQANPVRFVPLLREANHRIRFLEADEEKRLREAVLWYAPEREPELTLAINTGMRRGEQYSVTWGQVDLTRGFIELLKTKSGKPRRIPINSEARAALEKMRKRRFRRANALVCPSGYPRAWFEPCLASAGIENFRWHDLRHTFASRLVMAGVNLATVQELMGHQSVTMTLRYAHLSDDHKAAAVATLVPVRAAQPTEAAAQQAPQIIRRKAQR